MRYAPHILPLLNEVGEELSVAAELRANEGPLMSRKVVCKKDKDKTELYLHGFRRPPEKTAQARRKKKAKAQKDGRKLKKETLEYAAWTLIVKSLKPSEVSAAEIGQSYRLRWQIEIVSKRLKSVLQLDNLRSRWGSKLSEVYLLGKSVYALLIERRAGKLKDPQEIQWRVWKMRAEQVRPLITQVSRWQEEYLEQALNQLRERKRHRKRQLQLAHELLTKVLSTT